MVLAPSRPRLHQMSDNQKPLPAPGNMQYLIRDHVATEMDGTEIISVTQDIPDAYLAGLAKRKDITGERMFSWGKEMLPVFEIPMIIWLELKKEGYPMQDMSNREIIRLLKSRNMDDFISTKKAF